MNKAGAAFLALMLLSVVGILIYFALSLLSVPGTSRWRTFDPVAMSSLS